MSEPRTLYVIDGLDNIIGSLRVAENDGDVAGVIRMIERKVRPASVDDLDIEPVARELAEADGYEWHEVVDVEFYRMEARRILRAALGGTNE